MHHTNKAGSFSRHIYIYPRALQPGCNRYAVSLPQEKTINNQKDMAHCCCNHDETSSECQEHSHGEEAANRRAYFRMGISALLLFTGIGLGGADTTFFQNLHIRLLWYLAAYLPVGLPVMKEVWENLKKGSVFNEFTLMTLATIGAFYIGEYPEGVAVMLFYSLGEWFQDKAVHQAKHNIRALLDVRPETATVICNGKESKVNPREVQTGEVIEVKTGERVPLDGILLNETAAFNTSALTGESLPRNIHQDGEVLAGMIATDRVVKLVVTRPFEQSALSRILKMVQDASERKAPAELFIRRFARIYTPAVTGLAILIVLLPYLWSFIHPSFSYIFSDWLYRGLVFLVISCPCALVVSIPLGYFSGIGAASRLGILFKGGNYLDAITHINTVVFDKTGTLTQGTFDVQRCEPAEGMDEKQLLKLVASMEQNSTHPIAKAVTAYTAQCGITPYPLSEVKETAGYGLEADINGQHILVGNQRLLEKYHIPCPSSLQTDMGTRVVCAVNGQYAGTLLLADTLKADAPQAITALKALDIQNIQILSGDKQEIVSNFAARLGITQAYGDLLPDGKMQHLEELKKDPSRCIAFVGDGINDAPSLALSHVGIAMGGLGSDAAIETADVVLQTDQPSKIATAIRAGRLTRRIIWQNIAMALGIKLAVLLLGACGMATLWEAVFADVGVAVLAILNAIRLQRIIK